MFIDTHAHVNFNAFQADADAVIQRALENDTWMILAASEYRTAKRGLDYANRYERGVYAAVGLHPLHLEEMVAKDEQEGYNFRTKGEVFSYDIYEKLAKFEKTVAIGEIGLDYYHINLSADVSKIKQKQKDTFLQQLLLAGNLGLPAIIHCRQAHDDTLAILKNFKKNHRDLVPADRPWGVIHCFSGDEDLAWQYFSLGLMISFTGIITFSKQWDNLIRKMPPEKFMIETDCPYMTPEPYRGQRNEPLFVKYVAKRIAEIKNFSLEKVAEISTRNAREFFKI